MGRKSSGHRDLQKEVLLNSPHGITMSGHILFSNKTYRDELQFHNLKGEQKSQPASKQTENNSDLRNRILLRFGKATSFTFHLIQALSREIAYKFC
jgi:hypothetical protein